MTTVTSSKKNAQLNVRRIDADILRLLPVLKNFGMSELQRLQNHDERSWSWVGSQLAALPEEYLKLRAKLVYEYSRKVMFFLTVDGQWLFVKIGESSEENTYELLDPDRFVEVLTELPSGFPRWLMEELSKLVSQVADQSFKRSLKLYGESRWLIEQILANHFPS